MDNLRPLVKWNGLTRRNEDLFLAMIDFNIPQSGLTAIARRLQATTHNTANLSTERFARQRIMQLALPGGGGTRSRVDTVKFDLQIADAIDLLCRPQNEVQLVEAVVNRIAALRAFEANARVVCAQDLIT